MDRIRQFPFSDRATWAFRSAAPRDDNPSISQVTGDMSNPNLAGQTYFLSRACARHAKRGARDRAAPGAAPCGRCGFFARWPRNRVGPAEIGVRESVSPPRSRLRESHGPDRIECRPGALMRIGGRSARASGRRIQRVHASSPAPPANGHLCFPRPGAKHYAPGRTAARGHRSAIRRRPVHNPCRTPGRTRSGCTRARIRRFFRPKRSRRSCRRDSS